MDGERFPFGARPSEAPFDYVFVPSQTTKHPSAHRQRPALPPTPTDPTEEQLPRRLEALSLASKHNTGIEQANEEVHDDMDWERLSTPSQYPPCRDGQSTDQRPGTRTEPGVFPVQFDHSHGLLSKPFPDRESDSHRVEWITRCQCSECKRLTDNGRLEFEQGLMKELQREYGKEHKAGEPSVGLMEMASDCDDDLDDASICAVAGSVTSSPKLQGERLPSVVLPLKVPPSSLLRAPVLIMIPRYL